MTTYLACTSHPPLLLIRPREPKEEAELVAHRHACRAQIERFDPEQVIVFGNNHFAGFHYSLMPGFCIGFEARCVPDLGGFAGPLQVPADAARHLVEHTRREGFDPAVSYRMRVDHAFSQPLALLTGAIDRYPVIPVFISVFTPPFSSFRRSRLFGESVGRWVAASGRRTLLVGSGGLSHHPARYFPSMEDASPAVLGYQMDGDRGGTMDDAAWFERFSSMHIEGAEVAASGRRTASEMRLNPELDRRLLETMSTGRSAELDGIDAGQLVAEAGIGMLEIHSWIAAAAAHAAAGGMPPQHTVYAPVVAYGTGFAMMYGNAEGALA